MRIIITDEKKASMLATMFPDWAVLPQLEQKYLINKLRTELPPSSFIDYLMTHGPGFATLAALSKYSTSGQNKIEAVLIVSDPDPSYDTHILAIQAHLNEQGIPSKHVPTYCLEESWLQEEIWDKLKTAIAAGPTPPVISRAEAATVTAQINFISANELKKAFIKINSTLPKRHKELPENLLSRAAFLAIQITREIQRETCQKYYELMLEGETILPGATKKSPYFYYLSRIDHIVVKNQTSEIQKAWLLDSQRWENPEKRDFLENHFALKEPGTKVVRFPTTQEVLQIQWNMEIQNNFLVINSVVEDDIQENCNPINLKTLAREHLYNPKSKLSPLENMILELFYLYNAGLITWPKSGGYHTPPHLIQEFRNAYKDSRQFLKSGRIPQNKTQYENPNEWAICPTSAQLDTLEKIQRTLQNRTDLPSGMKLENVIALYAFIRTRFMQSILGNKHTDRRVSYLAGPVNMHGRLISPEKTYFFRKINDPREPIPEVGQILQLKPCYTAVYHDPLPASTAAVSYLLSSLLQPGTTKRKIHDLIKNDVLVHREQAMHNHRKTLEAWRLGGRIGKAPKSAFPPGQYRQEPSKLTPSIEPVWEHIMRRMERRVPSLVFPHEIQKIQTQILNIAAGSASADDAYRNWWNTLQQEINQIIAPERSYRRLDIRKFNT